MNQLRTTDPTKLGHHTILARIGAGGMGQVYLGRSPGGRLLAIKVVRDDFADSADIMTRFRREVETVGRVRSAYTAALVEAEVDARPYWLATEYVPGPTLAAAIRSQVPGGLPHRFCLLLFAALAEALADVHLRGVSHRDLKPQNIILSPDGPRLIDFGIARTTDQTALTQVGQTVGSLGYTAPEVITESLVGPAADVFALGATMAYAATGRGPFGDNAAGVVYRSLNGEIDVDGVDPDLAELITACVEVTPERRPDPAEIIRRCDVRSALTEDPVYRQLVAAQSPVPTVLDGVAGHPVPSRSPDTPPVAAAHTPQTPHEDPTVAAAPRTLLAPARPVPAAPPARDAGRRAALVSASAALVVALVGAVLLVVRPDWGDTEALGAGGQSSPTGAAESPVALPPKDDTPAEPEGAVTGMDSKCLHVANSDTENGAGLQLWTCNNTDAQRWKVLGEGRIQALGKCMDVEWSGTDNWTPVRLWDCNGTPAQQWESQADGTLKNVGSGRCLDLKEGKSDNGTPLIIFDCHTGVNQRWQLPT
ncbi:ricin-type beta-trefoil lectin domain protein [Streptomyces sp. NPDC059255]|uniref:protein kinase domain-containing protein n=1 Tax=Streptomyces sp. NPDC059255 TaxID=3346793 RepID=UPI0036AAD657